MSRPLAAATSAALGLPVLPLAAIVYLDIKDDPLYVWTGIGDLVFAPGQTGDPSLDGKTFYGRGEIVEISSAAEGVGGSDALDIVFPGVDPFEPAMRQVITYRNRWQFRRAVVWLMTLNPDTYAIEGNPFRIKTGRIDNLPYDESRGGAIKCRIEGQQAYSNTALGTRYSEQRDINPADTSQLYVHSLANMTAELGKNSAANPAIMAAVQSGFSTIVARVD